MMKNINTDLFEQTSPQLLGLAYRLLGSAAEAEDAVQDTYIKWQLVDKSVIRNEEAWLTTCCTNRCLDMLKSSRLSRTDYVGPWLPEPLHTTTDNSPEEQMLMASSLTTAFLMLLERLTPRERAAYLLHDIFDYSYEEISETLDMHAAGCRKLVSRARTFIHQEKVRFTPTKSQQEQLLKAFQGAIKTGSTYHLGELLSKQIELRADSGGKVAAVRDVLSGKKAVLEFVTDTLIPVWKLLQIEAIEINGTLGFVVKADELIVASISFSYNIAGALENIFIMRNPDKLSRLENRSHHNTTNGALRLN